MQASEIMVGHTYRNRYAGRTTRTVLRIGPKEEIDPRGWYTSYYRRKKDDLVVEYQQGDITGYLFLASFASWAGSDVNETMTPKEEPKVSMPEGMLF